MHSHSGVTSEGLVLPEVTAERVTLGRSVPAVEREHLCRYEYTKQFVEGKDVLDVACGTGYGSAMIFDAGARSVLGVDLDPLTVAQAQGSYARHGLAYSCGNAEKLDLPDGSFDVAVSFEQ